MSLYASAHWDLLGSQEFDPESASPALILTLRERRSPGSVEQPAPPGLQLSVVTVSLPALPTGIKDRLLKAYVDKAVQNKSHAILIGGVFGRLYGSLLWLENRVPKLDFDIRLQSNEDLCILPWCATGSMKCMALDATGPYTLVIEHSG